MTNPNIFNPEDNPQEVTYVTFSGRADFSPGWEKRLDIDGNPVDPVERAQIDRVPGDNTIAVQSMAEYIKHSQTDSSST